jgi:hypothetical protein
VISFFFFPLRSGVSKTDRDMLFTFRSNYLFFFKTSIMSIDEIKTNLFNYLGDALVVRQEDLANVKFYGMFLL